MQLHLFVHTVDALMVPRSTLSAQPLAALPKSAIGSAFDQASQSSDNRRIAHRPVLWKTVVGQPMQPDALAAPGG